MTFKVQYADESRLLICFLWFVIVFSFARTAIGGLSGLLALDSAMRAPALELGVPYYNYRST